MSKRFYKFIKRIAIVAFCLLILIILVNDRNIILEQLEQTVAHIINVSVRVPGPPSPPTPPTEVGGGLSVVTAPPKEEEEKIPAAEIPSTKTGTVTIIPDLGGSTTKINKDGSSAKISFPQKAVSVPVIAKVTSIPKSAIISFYPIPPGLKMAGEWVYSFTVRTTEKKLVSTFLEPVTLTFKYTESQVSELDESTLKVYQGIPSTHKWVVVPTSQVEPDTNTITATVTHFTLFTTMGSPSLVIPEERPSDLNADKKVDLVDLSILLYNWGEPKNPKADINNDGMVGLIDLSIMLYWWTG